MKRPAFKVKQCKRDLMKQASPYPFAGAESGEQENEASIRVVANLAPVLLWMTDASGAFTYVNQGWLDYTGRSKEQELGAGWTEGIHADDYANVCITCDLAFKSQASFRLEFRLRQKDGRYRWLLGQGVPQFLPDNTFAGFVGSCVDFTEEKVIREAADRRAALQAEISATLASTLDYTPALQHVADLVVPTLADWCVVDMVNPDGGLDLLAVAHSDPEKVHRARELRLQYPPHMDLPYGIGQVIRSGQAEFYPVIDEEKLAETAIDENYLTVIREIGLRSVILVPLKTLDEVLGVLTLIWSDSDLHYTEDDFRFAEELARRASVAVEHAHLYTRLRTKRERLQKLTENLEQRVQERTEELTQANRQLQHEVIERERTRKALARSNRLLEIRNRELQDFAYVASHDLQEPLRKIHAFTQLLESEHGHKLDEEGLHFLERIDDAATRMTRFISDLLTYSRIATKECDVQTVYLDRIIQDVLADLEIRLTETNGRVYYDDLCRIEADPLQMKQLFLNLIGNALKFHRKNVPPVIRIRAAGNSGSELCRIEVIDNGIGFDEKYAGQLFTPFNRLHGRSEYEGTGMGLAICSRIVDRHHGVITAHSTPGAGSTFTIVLPLVQKTKINIRESLARVGG